MYKLFQSSGPSRESPVDSTIQYLVTCHFVSRYSPLDVLQKCFPCTVRRAHVFGIIGLAKKFVRVFPERRYGKPRMNFLANPITKLSRGFFF